MICNPCAAIPLPDTETTWQTIEDAYGTWGAIDAAAPTWEDMENTLPAGFWG